MTDRRVIPLSPMSPSRRDGLARYIPINKGHFELDTTERHDRFHEILAEGWETKYAEYRRLWVDLPKEGRIRDYPLLLDLELSSVCNLHCPMCYTITDEFKSQVTRRYMPFQLLTRLLDEVAGNVYAVRLSLRGEATLHKQFIETVRYAKERGVREVSTLTHGGRLTGDFLRRLIDAGIDWITVSVDGIGDTYDRIRKPLTWAGTLARLREIQDLKESLGVRKPVVKVQGVWPAVREDPTAYYKALLPVTDLIAYNPLIDYLRNDSAILYEDNFACPQLYQRLVVGSDGRVMMCANDEDGLHIIGDANSETIHQIWQGEPLNRIRRVHQEPGGFMALEACRQCYYPRRAVPDETAVVDGRTITIENYVNRAQEVGR